MTEDPGSDAADPFRGMRDAYDRAMQGWSKAMEQMVSSDDFAEASGRFIKRYVEMHDSLHAADGATGDGGSPATRDDIARLAGLIANVERKLDEVSDEAHAMGLRLAAIEAALAPPAPPVRRRGSTGPRG